MKNLFFAFFVVLFSISLTAQVDTQKKTKEALVLNAVPLEENSSFVEPCSFDKHSRAKMDTDSQYKKITDDFTRRLAKGELVPEKSGTVYQIPVVIHVLYTNTYDLTDEQVVQGLQYLNNYWRKVAGTYGDGSGVDMEVEFSLAVRDPNGNCTNGIVRRDMNSNSTYVNYGVDSPGISDADAKTGRWPTNQYYNIYLVNFIEGANCFTGGGYTAGYAYLAGAHGQTYDGTICLMCSFIDETSNTLAHELGHAMNLYHTFEDNTSSCTTESNCATDGDEVCDTRPHRMNDCGGTGCTGSGTLANSTGNYMSYCGNTTLFTDGQKTRARTAITDIRGSFLYANGNNKLVPPAAPTVEFSASNTAVCTGGSVKFTDESTCIPNTLSTNTGWPNHTFAWSITGPVTLTSDLQNPTITFNTPGTYSVSLTITNNQGTFSETKSGYVTVAASPVVACSPTSQNAGNFAHTVNNVQFNTINSSTSTTTNVAYTDFSCSRNTTVVVGNTYEISVSIRAGGSYPEVFEVYIDYNNNGTFEVGELIHSGSTPASTSNTFTTNVIIPETAITNTLLRMRVYGEAGTLTNNERNCTASLLVGDVEDYGVLIIDETPSNEYDAGISLVTLASGPDCSNTFEPSLTLRNYGTATLTSVQIQYDVNGLNPQTYDWTGSLASNATTTIILPETTGDVGVNAFNATTVSGTLNGSNVDEELANDDASSNFTVENGTNSATLSLTTDNYGFETAWRIVDENSVTIAEGGNLSVIPGGARTAQTTDPGAYGNGETITESFCLADGCYNFTIYDDYGDGICCDYGNGSFSITDNSDGTVLVSGGTFTVSITEEFCFVDPVITVTSTPADVTINCEDSNLPANTGELLATTTCSGDVVINYADETVTGSCVNSSTITRTWTVTDDCSNSETHVQTITVVDNTVPTIDCGISTDELFTSGGTVTLPDYTTGGTYSDNCTATNDLIITQSPLAGTTHSDDVVVTITAEDECGNTSDCTINVTVTNNENISITFAPADVTISCEESTLPVNTGQLTATTGCGSNGLDISYNDDIAAGSCVNSSTITRTWTVTDACANIETHVQTITIIDNTAPIVDCGISTDETTTDTGSTIVPDYITGATISDNCSAIGDITIVQTPAAGSSVGTGTHNVTISATDECGNENSCTIVFTVTNENGITITNAINTSINVECIDDATTINTGVVTASTTCGDGSVTIDYADVSDGNSCPEVITRTWTVTDPCANEETYVQTITINDVTNPTASNPANISVQCSADVPVANSSFVTDAADNCTTTPIVTHLSDVSDGNTCPEVITRTYRVTDDCGNFTDVSHTITINDDIAPAGTAPANVTVQCVGDVPAVNTNSLTGVSDNCTAVPTVVHISDVSNGATCPEVITRTYRISDDCNNFIEVVQTITINDDIAPIASNPATINVACTSDVPAPNPDVVTDATDNCGIQSVVHLGDVSDNNVCNGEQITRTYRVTDLCGNTTDVTQTIFISAVSPAFEIGGTNPTECGGTDGFITLSGLEASTDYELTYNSGVTTIITTNGAGESVITGLTAGMYTGFTVSLSSCSMCETTNGSSVTLSDPNPPTVSAGLDVEVCEGTEITLTATNPDAADILWNNGIVDGVPFTQPTGTVIYTVTANLEGCTNTDNVSVTVYAAPTASNPAPTSVQCVGDVPVPNTAVVTDNSGGTTVTFVNDVSNGETCPEVITRTFRVTDECGSFIDVVHTITVNDETAPVIECPEQTETLAASDNPVCPDYTATAIVSDNCSASPTVSQSPLAGTDLSIGINIITLTATDACGNSSSCEVLVTVDDDLSIGEQALQSINIYPNPASETLFVDLTSTDVSNFTLTVYDMAGKLLIEQIHNEATLVELDVTHLATGMYQIRIKDENNILVRKITKH
jgi:hypothetical protein